MGLPAIVGAAQVIQRPDDSVHLLDRRGPVELMVDAVRDAGDETGVEAYRDRIAALWAARSTDDEDMVEAMTHGVAGRTAHRDASGSLRF